MSGSMDPQTNAGSMLEQALAAVGAGRRARARTLLKELVREQPEHAQAWLALAELAPEPRQARACARQVLRLEPGNVRAARIVQQAGARRPEADSRPTPPASGSPRPGMAVWLLVGLLFAAVCVLVSQTWAALIVARADTPAAVVPPVSPAPTATPTPTPTPSPQQRVGERLPALYEAWEARDWSAADLVLRGIAAIDAHYPGLRDAQCDTYFHWAHDLVAGDQVDRAYQTYRLAYEVCNEQDRASGEKELALLYLAGKWRYDEGQWQGAARALQQVYDAQPDYAQAEDLLYTSYISATHQLVSDKRLVEARGMAEAAHAISPQRDEPKELLEYIRVQLIPTPTPVPAGATGQLIEVNISEQRMYVWEDDRLIYNWLTSTGLPGRDTAPGRYSILDKIPEAWAGTWALRMPYWMGIYWAGTLENGIHALPINSNGVTLWGGYLGSRASFGCIILSTENARTLYNWAHTGTPVWIHY